MRAWTSRLLATLFFAATLAAPLHAILPDANHEDDCRDGQESRHIDNCEHDSPHAPHCDLCVQVSTLPAISDSIPAAALAGDVTTVKVVVDVVAASSIGIALPPGRAPPLS